MQTHLPYINQEPISNSQKTAIIYSVPRCPTI